MRFSRFAACAAATLSVVHAASIVEVGSVDRRALILRAVEVLAPEKSLVKRKGGGGRGGGSSGSSGSSSSSGRSGSSSSSSSSSSSTKGGSGTSGTIGGSSTSGRTSSSSSLGGSTRSGSGPARGYGGGNFYGGGAATPYKSGSRTPKGLIAGALIAPLALLALFPGLWLFSVYPYLFNDEYKFQNVSDQNATNPNGTETSLPVVCLCQEFSPCGCDENDDSKYLDSLIGNGSYDGLNKSLVNVADYEGKRSLIINGTLPNGTTSPGGSDDDTSSSSSSPSSSTSSANTMRGAIGLLGGTYAGYWVMGAIVLYTVALN